jgi:MYXO-CTERM domain-containing protein
VSTVDAEVPPGAVGRFKVPLEGAAVGDYTQTFGLVDEGVTWFADKANGGGPADDFLKLHVIVTDAPQSPPDGGAVADMGDGTDPGAGGGTGGNGDDGSGGAPPTTTGGKHGCSMATTGTAAAPWPIAFVALVALVTRRRRRNDA